MFLSIYMSYHQQCFLSYLKRTAPFLDVKDQYFSDFIAYMKYGNSFWEIWRTLPCSGPSEIVTQMSVCRENADKYNNVSSLIEQKQKLTHPSLFNFLNMWVWEHLCTLLESSWLTKSVAVLKIKDRARDFGEWTEVVQVLRRTRYDKMWQDTNFQC